MFTTTEVRDLQDFSEGQTVDISGIADMQGVVIKRIAPSGSTVYGRDCGEVIISCKSPAVMSSFQHEVSVFVAKDTGRATVTVASMSFNPETDRAPRGKYKNLMEDLKFPVGSFTAQQLADFNEIPYQYAANYCRDNLEVAGEVARVEGQRGKAAKLYKTS
jgi:hypothetical protein